jgi:hypothetical protein
VSLPLFVLSCSCLCLSCSCLCLSCSCLYLSCLCLVLYCLALPCLYSESLTLTLTLSYVDGKFEPIPGVHTPLEFDKEGDLVIPEYVSKCFRCGLQCYHMLISMFVYRFLCGLYCLHIVTSTIVPVLPLCLRLNVDHPSHRLDSKAFPESIVIPRGFKQDKYTDADQNKQ